MICALILTTGLILFSGKDKTADQNQKTSQLELTTEIPKKTISIQDLEKTIHKTGDDKHSKLKNINSQKESYSYNTHKQKKVNRKFNSRSQLVEDQSLQGRVSKSPKLPVPQNTYIRAYLQEDVLSSKDKIPVSAITYMDLSIDGKIFIPKNSNLIGEIYKEKSPSRIGIQFSHVIFPNSKEYSIKAVAVGEDNLMGLLGETDYKMAEKTTNIFAKSLLTAAAVSADISGSSLGAKFSSNLLDGGIDEFESQLDDQLQGNEPVIHVQANTKLKVVFY